MITDRLRRNAARARAHGAPAVPYTEAQVWAKTGGRCHLCSAPLDPGSWQVDHLLPIARGGPDVLANVAPACPACNRAKGARVTTLPDGPLRDALLLTLRVGHRLAHVGVMTAPLPPIIAPHVITLRVLPGAGSAHLTQASVAEVRAAVNHAAARVYQAGAELRIEIPRANRRPVWFASMPARGLQFGIGVDAANRVVGIDLARSPHVLVAGQSGSGKSETLRVITLHLARAGARLILVDADGDTFAPFARAASLVCEIATTTEAARDAICHARTLMDERALDARAAPLALVIDEAHMLDAEAREVVLDIAKRGRKRSVQVVLATHRPTREVLPKALTDQLTWAIAGRVQDAAGSRVILGQTGAQWLAGAGDMLLAQGGRMVRIQAARIRPSDAASIAQADHAPEAAPRAVGARVGRYDRAPNDDRVAFLVERYERDGARPSAHAIKQAFGGNTARAMRARDEAARHLGLVS